MALTPMEFDEGSGWSSAVFFSPKTGYEAASNYGSFFGYVNKNLKLAQIIWGGNATIPTAGQYQFALPSDFMPKSGCVVPIRNGDSMEVRRDGRLDITLTAIGWSGGSVMYALA